MTCRMRANLHPLAILLMLVIGKAGPALAQANAIHRETLQPAEFPGNGFHTVVVRTTLRPGGVIASHRHPGLEVAVLESGEVVVTSGTAAPLPRQSGMSWQVAPGLAHSVRNVGSAPAVIISTYIVDPSQPLASPIP